MIIRDNFILIFVFLLSILFHILLCNILLFSFCQYRLFVYTMPICLVANPLHITHHCSHTNWPTSSQEESSSPSQYWCSSRRASHPSSGSICLVLESYFSECTTSGYSHRYSCFWAWWSWWSERVGQFHDSSVSYYSGSLRHRSSAGTPIQPSDISISMPSWIASWAHRVLSSPSSSSGSSLSISYSVSHIEQSCPRSENLSHRCRVCEMLSSHRTMRISFQ